MRFTDDPDIVALYAVYADGRLIPIDEAERQAMAIIEPNELLGQILHYWHRWWSYSRRQAEPRTAYQAAVVTRYWHDFCHVCGAGGGLAIGTAALYRFDANTVNSLFMQYFGHIGGDA